jgi:hypothetical protein
MRGRTGGVFVRALDAAQEYFEDEPWVWREPTMRKLTFGTIVVLLLTLSAPPAVSVARAQGQGQGNGQAMPSLAIPVNTTNFTGTFNLTRFANMGGVVNAVGTLVGTLTTPTGPVSIVRNVAFPVSQAATTATCDILNLELGPLDLNLLGLVVHLNQIVLDIDAQSGPGNLLGNLLCSVAGLLDNPSGLAQILNNILRIIG